MPSKCFVAGCRSNYSPSSKVRVFSFPRDEALKARWLLAVHREDKRVPSKASKICEQHFQSDDIITEATGFDSKTREVIRVPLQKHRLRPNAVPSIFEGLAPSRKKKCVLNTSDLLDICNKEENQHSMPDSGYRMPTRQSGRDSSSSSTSSETSLEQDEESVNSQPTEAVGSPTTDRPFISILKSGDLEDDNEPKGVGEVNTRSPRKLTPVKSSPVKKSQLNSKSSPNALPSPYKHFPTVTVCLKEEDRVNVQRELGKAAKRASLSSGSGNDVVKLQTKRRKVEKPSPTVLGRVNDCFCWVCHRENVHLSCITCPRAYHMKCCGEYETLTDWVCPECKRIVVAEAEDTRSTVLSQISLDKLHTLLRFCLAKMKQRAGVAFHQPVSLVHYPKYLHYVIHPMDFSLLEKKIKQKAYGCTEAFLADVKWILHNSCVFNGNQHPLSTNAKSIVKTCDNDMQEIEVCPDCFCHSIVRNKYWFSEVCQKPHPLVWAKLKGFPYWPAKVVRIVDGNVDARFFGAHDRAWVPIVQCYHLSKEMPTTSKPKKKGNYETALDELNAHVQLLIQKFGIFEYAPYRTVFDPANVYNMYHGIEIDKISQEDIPFNVPANITKNVCNSKEFETRLSIESNEEDQSKNSTEVGVSESTSICPEDTKDKNKPCPDNSNSSIDAKESPNETEVQECEKTGLPELNSSQLSKIESALQRIKGYVSVNPDTEKEPEVKESVSEFKETQESSTPTKEKESSKKEGSFLSDLIKIKPLPPVDLTAIEEEVDKDSTPAVDSVKKNDLFSLKLIETIASCKAKLGLSGGSDLMESSSTDSESLEDEEDDIDNERDKEISDDDEEHKDVNKEKDEQIKTGDAVDVDMSEEETSDESSTESDDDSNSDSADTDIEAVEDINNTFPKDADKASEEAVSKAEEKDNSKDTSMDLVIDKTAQTSTAQNVKQDESSLVNKESSQNVSLEPVSDKSGSESESNVIDTDINNKPEDSSTPVPSVLLDQSTSSIEMESAMDISEPPLDEEKTDESKVTEKEASLDAATNSVPITSDETAMNPQDSTEVEDEDIYICNSPLPKAPTPPLICLDDGSETEPELSHKVESNINTSPGTSLKSPPSSRRLPTPELESNSQNTEKYVHNLIQAKLIPTNARKSIKRPLRRPSFEEDSSDEDHNDEERKQMRPPQFAFKSAQPLGGAIRTFNTRPNASSLLLPKTLRSSDEVSFSILGKGIVGNSSDLDQNTSSVDSQQNMASTTPEEKDVEIIKLRKKLSCLFSAVQLQHWKHNQEKTELRHNMNQILLEMRTALEADKKIAIEALAKKMEQEKNSALDEAKKKQWCAFCHQEARYGCCWNTSYCSITCQKRHFFQHRTSCTQMKSKTIEGDIPKPKVSSPSVVNDGKDGKKLILLNVVPKPDSKTSSAVSQQDKTIHKISLNKVISPSTPIHLVSSSVTPTSHPLKFVLAPMKTNCSTANSESASAKTSSSASNQPSTMTTGKNTTEPTSSDSVEKSESNQQESISILKTSNEKPNELNLEEIYFPSPPTVNFEGLDTALPDENVCFDNLEETSDAENADNKIEEDIVFSDSETSTEMVNLGWGVEIKAKLMNQCMIFGKTAPKFARSLVDVIFPDYKLLASCSALGNKSNVTKLTRAGLPLKKVDAIVDAVLKRFPEASRSEIVQAINLKCKEARMKTARLESEGKTKKLNLEEPTQVTSSESSTQKKATVTFVRNLTSNASTTQKTVPASLPLATTSQSILKRVTKPSSANIVHCRSPTTLLIRPKQFKPATSSPTITTNIRPITTATTSSSFFTNKMPPQIPLPSMQKNATVKTLLTNRKVSLDKTTTDITKIVFPVDILKKNLSNLTPPTIQRPPVSQPINIILAPPPNSTTSQAQSTVTSQAKSTVMSRTKLTFTPLGKSTVMPQAQPPALRPKMQVLLIYNGSAKVREVTPKNLMEVVKSTFGLVTESIKLQKFNREFDEYVDLDNIDDFQDKDKIKVVAIPLIPEISKTDVEEVITDQSMDSASEIQQDSKADSWPNGISFNFNNFSELLQEALYAEDKLSFALSVELINQLADFVYEITSYPNKRQLEEVCKELIYHYPHLKNLKGDGTRGWELKLRNRIKRKRVLANQSKEKPPQNSNLPENGINFVIKHPEGEDEVSASSHKKVMCQEYAKPSKEVEVEKVNSLMARTFSFRRQWIVEHKPTVLEVKKEYPFFFEVDHQIAEFQRLQNKNLPDDFMVFLSKYCSRIIRLYNAKFPSNECVKYLAKVVKKCRTKKKEYAVATALWILPALLDEKSFNMGERMQGEKSLIAIEGASSIQDAVTGDNFRIVAESICPEPST